MRLPWNEVRVRAAAFAREWSDAAYESGETQSFYNDFFEVFGVRRRTVARYEQHVAKLGDRSGFIDLFWPGVLIVEQTSANKNTTTRACIPPTPLRHTPGVDLPCPGRPCPHRPYGAG